MFFIVVSYLAIVGSPSSCVETPNLQTARAATQHTEQVSVNTADTGQSNTKKTQEQTMQQAFQQNLGHESASKPGDVGPPNTGAKRLVETSLETPRVRQFTITASSGQSTRSYPQANQTRATQPQVGQAGVHAATLATATLWKETEATHSTTEMSIPTTSNRLCPPKVEIFQNITKRLIFWYFDIDSCEEQLYWILILPEGFGFVVEFHVISMTSDDSLVIVSHDEANQTVWRNFTAPATEVFIDTNKQSLGPLLLRESAMTIIAYTPFGETKQWRFSFFNLSYSAHVLETLPELFTRDLNEKPVESDFTYLCTGISDLPKVITCDGIPHCEHGEDEANCTYRAQGCGDWFPYNDQCLKVEFVRGFMSIAGQSPAIMPLEAEESCQLIHGATLGLFPDSAGVDIVAEMIRKSGFHNAVVGIHKVKPVSLRLRHLYRFLWQWGDQGSPIAYEQQELQRSGTMADCAVLDVFPVTVLRPFPCVLADELHLIPQGYVCMRPKPNYTAPKLNLPGVSLPRASYSPDMISTKECPDGSVVQTFHRCHWGQQDEGSNSGWSPNKLPLFQCRFGPPVHYSLLCDGNDDCADRSDEMDCQHPQFTPLLNSCFICRNLQAIPAERRCDGTNDCFDESDEESCFSCDSQIMCVGVGCIPYEYAALFNLCPATEPSSESAFISHHPASVELDGYGMSRLEVAVSGCREGFYSCRDGYCIPTFLLNNGEKDCRYGEDEDIPVHNMTCAGYYRCQGSGSCVHKDYVCDGIYHCPNKDDERFCNLTCSQGCICEGHAYKCSVMIDPLQHLHVRYLDLSHASNVSLENIHFMEYLSFLNLSFCYLGNVNLTNMHQLQTLDLSFNSITELASLNLHLLPRLLYLNLSSNPFVKTLNSSFTTMLNLGELQNVRSLIMSNVSLEVIRSKVFVPLSKLTYLDIRANPVHSYDKESFGGLTALEELHTDESKLCCSYFHPSLSRCHAPVDELSSCSDLLAQDFFRVFLWAFSVLAIVGNTGVLIYRLFVSTHTSPPAFRVLVKNLCASDLLMGVYMMLIGVADAQYRGVYVAKEGEWTKSTACTIAGFLSLVSNEVSAFVICLITLDRVLVLCFPLNSRVHLSSRVTTCVCCVVWVTGIVLAAVPLLAGMEFYGLNGICLPLPITRKQFSGQTYAFGVFIILNFILFVFIGVGQVFIYLAVRKASTAAGSQRRDNDMTLARRLFLVVFTDFCCWFPIGLMGLLAASGTPIPGQVNVWAAIFALPLNSALNPFLYTLNGLMEQWRKRRMEKRTRMMIAKLKTEIPKWQPSSVQELIRICVRSKLVEKETVMKWLGITVEPTTEVCGKEDLPSDGDISYAYDSQNMTQSTNFDFYDKADNTI